jgi:hypothetical protein
MTHFSTLLKIVIDAPSADHDRELAFWQEALGQALPRFPLGEYHGAPLHGHDMWLAWWVMRDPAGLPFCVLPEPPGSLNDQNARRWDLPAAH